MNKTIFTILIIVSCSPCALASSATITLDSIIDTPDRTITHSGTAYEITDIGIYRIDHDISATVNVSGVQSFQISLIDKYENSVWGQTIYSTKGHETLIIPAGTAKTPGLYALTIWHQRRIIAVRPVVISVYDLSISSASQIEPGETLHVVVDINRDGVPVTVNETVKVVLSQGSTLFEEIATPVDAGKYEANINIPAIASGDFSLYCAVTTDRTIIGYPETIGAASYGTVTVCAAVPEVIHTVQVPLAPDSYTSENESHQKADAVPSEVAPSAPTSTTKAQPPWKVYGLFAAVLSLVTAYLVKRKRHER